MPFRYQADVIVLEFKAAAGSWGLLGGGVQPLVVC